MTESFDSRLLEVIEDVDRRPVSQATERRARHVLLDTFGCALAGLRADTLVALAGRYGAYDSGSVRIPGMPPLSASGAASLLAVGACWDEACEGHGEAHGRPGLHAAPAVLALASARALNIADAVKALVIGYEVGVRAGVALRIRPGMHVDGAWGLFATVAAAGRALALAPRSILGAVRSAACQVPFSLYLPIAAGSFARNTYIAHAQTVGLQLAHAAAAGILGPAGAIEVYAEKALGITVLQQTVSPATRMIESGYLKAFASVKHAHYPVAAALVAMRKYDLKASDIDAITIRVYREAIVYCSNRSPATPIQAQFSMSYAVAAAIVLGDLGPGAYTKEALEDRTIKRLEACVRIEEDAARTAANARGAEVLFSRGEHCIASAAVDHVLGDPAEPFDDAAVRRKFEIYAGPTLGAETARIADHFLNAAMDRPLFPPSAQIAV